MMLRNTLHWQTARALRPCLRPPLSIRLTPGIPRHRVPRAVRFLSDNSQPPIPSFRDQIARTSEVKSFSEHVRRPSIRNQVLVCVPSCNFCRWVFASFFFFAVLPCWVGNRFLICCGDNEYPY